MVPNVGPEDLDPDVMSTPDFSGSIGRVVCPKVIRIAPCRNSTNGLINAALAWWKLGVYFATGIFSLSLSLSQWF